MVLVLTRPRPDSQDQDRDLSDQDRDLDDQDQDRDLGSQDQDFRKTNLSALETKDLGLDDNKSDVHQDLSLSWLSRRYHDLWLADLNQLHRQDAHTNIFITEYGEHLISLVS